jgi:hypothetical protein
MTEVQRVTLTEQELFDRLSDLFIQQMVLSDDISQLKKDAKFHKDKNPKGISKDDLKFVAQAAKLEAKSQFEEYTANAHAVAVKFKLLSGYDD